MQMPKKSLKKGLPEIFSGSHFATAYNYYNEKQETFKRRIGDAGDKDPAPMEGSVNFTSLM